MQQPAEACSRGAVAALAGRGDRNRYSARILRLPLHTIACSSGSRYAHAALAALTQQQPRTHHTLLMHTIALQLQASASNSAPPHSHTHSLCLLTRHHTPQSLYIPCTAGFLACSINSSNAHTPRATTPFPPYALTPHGGHKARSQACSVVHTSAPKHTAFTQPLIRHTQNRGLF